MLAHSEAALVVDVEALARFDPPPAPRPGNADECALLYTSGTTGKPKGCLLSNFYFLNVGQRYVEEGGLCALREGEERLITPLPLFHMNALACSTMAMPSELSARKCSRKSAQFGSLSATRWPWR